MRLRRRVCSSLSGVARVFVTGQCVKYQKVVLTQMVILLTFMLETKAPRSLHIVQSTGVDFGWLLHYPGCIKWENVLNCKIKIKSQLGY